MIRMDTLLRVEECLILPSKEEEQELRITVTTHYRPEVTHILELDPEDTQ